MGIVIYSILGIQAYIAVEVSAGHLSAVFIAPFAIAAIIASVIDRQLGLRGDTTTRNVTPTPEA